jgi:ArsR family transcriptional regulator, arsenate/arsenite/antimonite-responsive transcriptional repressor
MSYAQFDTSINFDMFPGVRPVALPVLQPGDRNLDGRRAVRLFHALSDDTRLAIVARLRRGERCVCELTDLLGEAQPLLSFHLKVLKDAGIVVGRREGRWVHYRVDPDALAAAAQALAALRPEERSSTACCD